VKVLFTAGDVSGDQHAARVAGELKSRGVSIAALGGPALKSVADLWLGDLVSQGMMGFWEPLRKIPYFLKLLNNVVKPTLFNWKPDVVVPTDFYGFNRHVARVSKQAGRRVYYFVSPQVWASRPGRIQTLQRVVDRMLVIFPFEEKLYREQGVPVDFVGHPLAETVPFVAENRPRNVEPLVGLLPGSRPSEVRRLLPVFLETAERLSQNSSGFRFVLFAAPGLSDAFYQEILRHRSGRPLRLDLVRDEGYAWRQNLDGALACSGTATLENALLGVPTVVAYRTSWPTYALARLLINVNAIAMPNILTGKSLMPERIQGAATPPSLADALSGFFKDRSYETVRKNLMSVRSLLGGPGCAKRTADIIAGGISQ